MANDVRSRAPRPLFAGALALALGSALGSALVSLASEPSGATPLVIALGCAAATGVLFGRRALNSRQRYLGFLLAVLAFAAAWRAWNATANAAPTAIPEAPEEGPATARARAGRWRAGLGSRASLQQDRHGRLPVTHSEPAPDEGEWVLALGPGEPVQPARGPVAGGAPQAGWSHFQADEVVRLGPRQEPGAIAAARAALVERLEQRLSAPSAALLAALLVGDRSSLESEVTELFTRTGLRHLLAVSGLHVALVLAALVVPLARLLAAVGSRLGIARDSVERFARCALLCAFVPIAGSSPPVLRAALAAVLASLPPRLGPRGTRLDARRRIDPLSLWGAALSVEIAADPIAIRDVSVQLSYMAVLGLLLCTGPLARSLGSPSQRTRSASAIAPPRSPLVHALIVRVSRGARTAIAASVVASIATLPVLWARFGEVSPWGIPLTPIAVPWLALLLSAGWLVALAPVPFVPQLVDGAAQLGLHLLGAADRLPGTPCVLPPRPAWLLALLVAGWAWTLVSARGPRPPWSGPRSVLRWAWAAVLVPWTLGPTGLEVHALDVGHGTCVVLRAPGSATWIYDAGSRSRPYVGSGALEPLLRSWEVRRPALVLSHAHRDHASAFDHLIERFPPRRVAGAVSAHWAERLPHDCLLQDTTAGALSLESRGHLALELVRGDPLPGNEGSRSLVVRWRDQTLLLTGDAEQTGLEPLLYGRHSQARRRVRMLLAPHHGTAVGRVPELLDVWHPHEVWISAGGPAALQAELDRRGWVWRSTQRDGPLALFLQ